ncbi:acyl-CoA dehydrogenase family protein [Conexibacter arvalis]|uniref:Alkylation response protein AidB-like acyl-CoA dehydrogenase n=1 Tax=Conexibacter arvalis TaxID=912552 RepID=A0A840IEE8_9ACTN|nr:acyl-CoA dehydrogenase family protein [Conexibacter arvalis]MBB4662388.1 alkylation response protein AidB-like acyl-CoA dehydrogenase [Conexibacter arvalis]
MTALDERAAAAVRDRIAATAAAVDRERSFPAASLAALGEQGLLGLTVPAEHGGAGGGLSALAEAGETVGGACASTGMTFLMHAVTAATVAGGGGPRAAALLRELADGERIGTLAFSERGTGAHFHAPELRVERDGDGRLRISGRKSFVTSGGHAGLYLVLVQSDDGGGLDCYAVDGGADGIAFEGSWEGIGMAGNSSVAMVLDGVAVSEEDRIGVHGAGGALVFDVVAPFFLVGLAAVNVGIAAAAQAAATEHAKRRSYADGSTLAEVQSIQHALADIDLTVRQARLLVRDAAALGDAGDPGALVAIMAAKVAATEAARDVTQQALEICGGQGCTPALPIERHLRDARAGAVMAPTNGVLRSWIGKALAGLPVP